MKGFWGLIMLCLRTWVYIKLIVVMCAVVWTYVTLKYNFETKKKQKTTGV